MNYTIYQIIWTDAQIDRINNRDGEIPDFYRRYLDVTTHQKPEHVAAAWDAGDYTVACQIQAPSLNDVFDIGNVGPDKFISYRNQRMHSLSVGDVIETETGKRFLIASFGFTDLEPEDQCKVIEIQRTAIDRFKKSWPCHGIPNDVDLIMAAFDNGDLIDLELIDAADGEIEGCQYEETEALAALLQDAERYASKRPTAPGMIDGGYIYK